MPDAELAYLGDVKFAPFYRYAGILYRFEPRLCGEFEDGPRGPSP
jgi:hypothetical protein